MNIKRIRERRGLTQAELAKRAAVHRVSVARIESGTLTPSLPTLERIAAALAVRPAKLLE